MALNNFFTQAADELYLLMFLAARQLACNAEARG